MDSTPLLEIGLSSANVPFEIHSMEWIRRNRWQQNSVAHRHNYFVIIWVIQGAGTHFIDLQRFDVENETVFCISPGQVHQLLIEDSVDGYVISFTNEFFGATESNFDLLFNTGLFNTFSKSPVIKVSVTMRTEMLEVAERMVKEYENFFLLRAEILRGFLKIFLIYLTRQYEVPEQMAPHSRNMELVKRFLELLEKKYISTRVVSDYADELLVTPNYLNEIVKKLSGFPASHHIQQRVVLEAKRQAAYSDNSMKEIAYSLGFDDTAHFSKFFKNVAGTSFSDFKKERTTQIEKS
ncbi:MAG: helix-turn-helix domain-containing protein [Chitinophagaceae bacterium]|nr:helix-turn-helix domain-containing protein [Chitinophagaceae bacterium]